MPSTTDHARSFLKVIREMAPHRHRRAAFGDFLELAYCVTAKPTKRGEAADRLEERYMAAVRRNQEADIRRMLELLGLTVLAVQNGGCDFPGTVATELELLSGHIGQFFTPYDVCRMMAEMLLADAGRVIDERGFVTLAEPACGAGALMLVAADVLAAQGHDIGTALFIEATDLSATAYQMAYVQLAERCIPAQMRQGNTLTLEISETAFTPAIGRFFARNRKA